MFAIEKVMKCLSDNDAVGDSNPADRNRAVYRPDDPFPSPAVQHECVAELVRQCAQRARSEQLPSKELSSHLPKQSIITGKFDIFVPTTGNADEPLVVNRDLIY